MKMGVRRVLFRSMYVRVVLRDAGENKRRHKRKADRRLELEGGMKVVKGENVDRGDERNRKKKRTRRR